MSDFPSCGWSFWVDRGGTFTDLVAIAPDGRVLTHKLLSEQVNRYGDAVIEGIRQILASELSIDGWVIESIKMGTTVGTNALLEGKGGPTLLITNQGFKDALFIGNQSRPDIFALDIERPDPLYTEVVEIGGRIDRTGAIIEPLDVDWVQASLKTAFAKGYRNLAIHLLHAWKNPAHEERIAELARGMGFEHVVLSSRCSPGIRFIPRGATTVIDAYLSPVIKQYRESFQRNLDSLLTLTKQKAVPSVSIMQSNGGLCDLLEFKARDSILSGPAGGMIGAKAISERAGFDRVITFDMGGTSTDVAHYAGSLERSLDTEIEGRSIRVPSLSIHTVAAGGGSILTFDGARLLVGPESAGANPGPACYRQGGPLTVTDANLILGKIRADHFPKVFGPEGNGPIDETIARTRFSDLLKNVNLETDSGHSIESLAEGFIAIAVEEMALAIRKISTQRGHDLREYALCCYGAAGGQHACLVANRLGIDTILINPYAGVLSALGMGLADHRSILEEPVVQYLEEKCLKDLVPQVDALKCKALSEWHRGPNDLSDPQWVVSLGLRYEGSDHLFSIPLGEMEDVIYEFEDRHERQFGFKDAKRKLWIETLRLEMVVGCVRTPPSFVPDESPSPKEPQWVSMYLQGTWQKVQVHERRRLSRGQVIEGPALLLEHHATTIVEPGWWGEINRYGDLILKKHQALAPIGALATQRDPVLLQLFNARFMAIAEEMGFTLQKTAASVNIRERLDFSCAIFDCNGQLVANAPHIPVHLGSMSQAVQSLIEREGLALKLGTVWLTNSPYAGGTHLPDMTVVTPVYSPDGSKRLFFLASRGHHADIGGVTPGSMPPHSKTIYEEGLSTSGLKLVQEGVFLESAVRAWLSKGPYPARNPNQNIADIKAQIAANHKGQRELLELMATSGLEVVQAYMGHIQDYAEEAIRSCIEHVNEGAFSVTMDAGAVIQVQILKDPISRSVTIDFSDTSPTQDNNQNAPIAIVKAAVLYVFRTLSKLPIPLNEGCLRPIRIHVPEGSFLNPIHPAAVVAGNVETSQQIVDALYGALGLMAGSQGTMNNLTFGNDRYQYYETLCGGTGAGLEFDGADAIHSHMTNSRLTDPEILEWNYPVRLERFEIRRLSGGQGQHRGGDGVIRTLRFLEPMSVGMLSNRRRIAPHGLKGGDAGQTGVNQLLKVSGEAVLLPESFSMKAQAGDQLEIQTPGGGGFGPVQKQAGI